MKTKYFVVFLFIVLTSASLSAGTVYYIDATGGNYSNGGLSPSSPLKMIDQVNRSSFLPGDSILFKSGQTHYGNMIFSSSGNTGMPITIGAYGGGAKPILNGSIVISSWTGPSNGVYSASCGDVVEAVFEDTIPLVKATSSACSDGNWFTAASILYYKPTTGVPGGHIVGYIAMNYVNLGCLNVSNKSNIAIDGLSFINFYYGICGMVICLNLNFILIF